MKKINEKAVSKVISPAELENLLFHLLRTIYQFEQIEVTNFSLSYELIYILKLLKRIDQIRISDIAEEMKIKVFTATRLIDQLEEHGYVRRERTNSDKRSVNVKITPDGSRIVKKIQTHTMNLIFENMKEYSDKEMNLIFTTIRNLDKILGIEPGRFIF